MSRVAPPRAVFVDHPVGRTFGPPHDRVRNQAVLTVVLAALPEFTAANQIRDIHCTWEDGGSREWETELRAEILHDR